MNISVTLLCAFSEHLTIKGNAPRTIINKLSQVKRFVLLSGGNITPFEDSRLSMAKDAQLKRKDVRTNVKPPIPIHLFKQVLLYIPETFEGFSLKAILLIIYYGALRQSEIVPPTIKDFNHKRYMCKSDIQFVQKKVFITLRWAKNIKKSHKFKTVLLTQCNDSVLCPVYALKMFFICPQGFIQRTLFLSFKMDHQCLLNM